LAFQLGHHSLCQLLRRLAPPQFQQSTHLSQAVATASQTPIKGIQLGQTVARPVAQSAAYS
jgi:hypothetical protein